MVCNTVFVQTPHISLGGGDSELIVVCDSALEYIQSDKLVFILQTPDCLPKHFDCNSSIAIVDSGNPAVMELAFEKRLRTITCGRSSSDTLTLTSHTSDSAVVALQRSISAFDGTIIEPFEIPVVCHEMESTFYLLAVAASYCLLGQKNPLLGVSAWNIS